MKWAEPLHCPEEPGVTAAEEHQGEPSVNKHERQHILDDIQEVFTHHLEYKNKEF